MKNTLPYNPYKDQDLRNQEVPEDQYEQVGEYVKFLTNFIVFLLVVVIVLMILLFIL